MTSTSSPKRTCDEEANAPSGAATLLQEALVNKLIINGDIQVIKPLGVDDVPAKRCIELLSDQYDVELIDDTCIACDDLVGNVIKIKDPHGIHRIEVVP